jgi:hypothetical protein
MVTNVPYMLTFAKAPGTFSSSDEGGPMLNGALYTGSLHAGDLDMWSFDAQAGDGIVLRMGATNFNPWIQLFDPNGALVGSVGTGNGGFVDVDLMATATNSGTYIAVVASYVVNTNGNYWLSLGKARAPIVVSPGDQGGPMTNGWKHSGALVKGDLDVWSFEANAGDGIVLRMGATNFNPWIRLYGPNGVLVGASGSGNGGFVDPDLMVTATNTGTFTVVAGSVTVNPNGNYTLTLARSSGQIFVTPGHAGGSLTNGWKHTGALHAGDLDVWSFDANSGDGIVLRMGATNFNPWIPVIRSERRAGRLGCQWQWGFVDPDLSVRATNTGTFVVVAARYTISGNGNYTLTLAKAPGEIFVTPLDEGGPLTNGWKHTGALEAGDLDVWGFAANAGDSIVLRMGATNFNPWIRLFGPNGALVGSAASGNGGFVDPDLSVKATNTGVFTVVAARDTISGSGNYTLTLAQSPGAIFVAPMDEGGPLTNGWMHTGGLQAGDVDVYSFPAIVGDGYVLRMGSTNYNPWLRLYGPDGQLIGFSGTGNGGFNVAEISGRATNGRGMFFRLVGLVWQAYFCQWTSGSYFVGLNLGQDPTAPDGCFASVDQGGDGSECVAHETPMAPIVVLPW